MDELLSGEPKIHAYLVLQTTTAWSTHHRFCRNVEQGQRADLQIASVLHVLFHIDTPLEISNVIDAEAIKAAINMVDVCMQHFSWKR